MQIFTDELPTTSSPHTVDSLQPIVDSKFQYNSPGNESGILSPNKYDLGIGNLSLIDSKDGHINEKVSCFIWFKEEYITYVYDVKIIESSITATSSDSQNYQNCGSYSLVVIRMRFIKVLL